MTRQSKPEWAVRLANAIKDWAPRNGYRILNRLASELDISEGVWPGISAGSAIAQDVEIYAKLFLRTGLSEADPRTIPARIAVLPTIGNIETERAWSEDQWQQWLAQQGAIVSSQNVTSNLESNHPRDVNPPGVTVGTMIDDFIKAMGRQVGEEAARVVTQELSSHRLTDNGISSASIEELAAELIERLAPFKDKSSLELRRAIGKRTLVHKIGELQHLLQLLTLSDTEKKHSLGLGEKFND